MNPRSQSQPRPLPPRAVLIAQLHELARKLGRTPKFQETSKNYREYGVHHPIYFKQRFGSWTKALRAAHLPLNLSQEFTREELIAQLRNLSTHLGAKLTQNDVREARDRHTCAPVTAFTREFGTLHKALVAAGVNRPLATSESELIADLKELARKLGCSPGTSEIGRASKRGECRGPEVYAKRFGSVGRALRSAGLPPTNFPYTRHSLIKTLRELETQLGRLPTQRDIRQGSAEGDLPGASTFSRYFGGLKNALRLARLAPPKETLAQKKRRMAKELREVSLELGHAPFSDEWTTFNRQGKLASVSTYILYFGSPDFAW